MIKTKDVEECKKALISAVLSGYSCSSRFGEYLFSDPKLLVIEKAEKLGYEEDYFRNVYMRRLQEVFKKAAEKLKKTPYTRRVSIPIWRPEDHLAKNPPAITEISFLYDEKLHLTAYIRSLDVFNYFEHNFDFLSFILEKMSLETELEAGSIAMIVAVPHVYRRDLKKAEKEAKPIEELFGHTELATHIVDDYISSAWHSALETIYRMGRKKRTEWDIFSGQETSNFVHRLFIEVRKPEENRIHDKAPFTEKYGIDYAHSYVIGDEGIDVKMERNILKEGEEYSYAERARYCLRDEFKVDQLFMAVKKLKENCRRDCYVAISRPWDIESSEPPCLRGYQFVKKNAKMLGIFYMRSNDAYGAMHANMFAFSLLTKYVAETCGVGEYKYYHFAVDAHIYSGFMKAVEDILYPKSPKFMDFMKTT